MDYEKLKLDKQLCFRLYAASRLITQAYRPYLDKLGVTYPQYLVLMVLWETDELPVNDIAKRLALETNTVTPLIQRMEREGICNLNGKEEKSGKNNFFHFLVLVFEMNRTAFGELKHLEFSRLNVF